MNDWICSHKRESRSFRNLICTAERWRVISLPVKPGMQYNRTRLKKRARKKMDVTKDAGTRRKQSCSKKCKNAIVEYIIIKSKHLCKKMNLNNYDRMYNDCLLYTSPSPRD